MKSVNYKVKLSQFFYFAKIYVKDALKNMLTLLYIHRGEVKIAKIYFTIMEIITINCFNKVFGKLRI